MRTLFLLLAILPLAGCEAFGLFAGVTTGVSAASIAAIQRTPLDAGVSVATGRDCSLVRLDKQQSYCAPDDTPRPLPYCTRSLGTVNCWAQPQQVTRLPQQVGDAPDPTPAQRDWQRRSWLERELGMDL